jgi:hypothetical protein
MKRRQFVTLLGGAAIVAGQHPIAVMLDFVAASSSRAAPIRRVHFGLFFDQYAFRAGRPS